MKSKVILDESKFGDRLYGPWRWSFHEKIRHKEKKAVSNETDLDDGNSSLITVTDNKEPILIAVTKSQYKSWSKQDIIVRKRPELELWRELLKKVINKRINSIKSYINSHFIFLSRRYLYIFCFNHCIILSKYGLRIVKPKGLLGGVIV